MKRQAGILIAIILLSGTPGRAQFMGSIQYLPAAASAPGACNTCWKTDLYLYNPMSSAITFWDFFCETGENNLIILPETVHLDPGEARTYPDVL